MCSGQVDRQGDEANTLFTTPNNSAWNRVWSWLWLDWNWYHHTRGKASHNAIHHRIRNVCLVKFVCHCVYVQDVCVKGFGDVLGDI